MNHACRRDSPTGRRRTYRERLCGRAVTTCWSTPLMRVEPIAVDLGGQWSALAITSANAPNAIARNPAHDTLIKLPLLAVGRRSAEAAQQAGFADVTSANGDVRELVRLIEASRRKGEGPVLYLAGEDRASDLVAELPARGMAVEMRVVYRAVTTPLPESLIEALKGPRSRCRPAFFASQCRKLRGGSKERGGCRTGSCGTASLPVGAGCRTTRRRPPHYDCCPAGRSRADRIAAGRARVIAGTYALFALFPACGVEPIRRGKMRMADKPTTPDPAGGGRRKRTAPTIDLKATEVSTTSQASGLKRAKSLIKPRTHVLPKRSLKPPREPDAAGAGDGSPQGGAALWQMLAAGGAGAAIMTGVLLCSLVRRFFAGSQRGDGPRGFGGDRSIKRSHRKNSKQRPRDRRHPIRVCRNGCLPPIAR